MAKNVSSSSPAAADAAILETLGDFTSKENWDKFFSLRGAGDCFEWYAEWPHVRGPLLSLLTSLPAAAAGVEILVPGCGSSALSERLYDAGFRRITNADFSRVVVADMLRRHARARPEMRWRVMDITDLQFADESFDVVLDKGGLDALMEPEAGSKLGMKYLKEVKRVLRSGGKFVCLTLAESHVLALLLSEFRFGWEMSIQAVPNQSSNKSAFQTFMVAMTKGKLGVVNTVKSLFDHSAGYYSTKQVNALIHAIENENSIRESFASGVDVLYSLQDLQLGAIGNLKVVIPGRRCQLILGEHGSSLYCYKAVLLDAQKQPEPFVYHCGVFIVPKTRAHEWLFTSEEGQWNVVESAKAARLIMVFLDSRHTHASMDVIQKDLSPLVKNLEPGNPEEEALIPFMMASDGVKQRDIVKQVTSEITGPIVVEDVTYENVGDKTNTSEVKMFRRLIFQRSVGLVQSEALLVRDPSNIEIDKKNKKRRGQKKGGSASKSVLRIDHRFLGSSYHIGIISGFALVASALSVDVTSGKRVKAIVVGLGAGLFPMFLRGCLPFLDIEVVELDPVVADLAMQYFGFAADEQLKVCVGDGIQFIQGMAAVESSINTKKSEGHSDNTSELADHGSKVDSLSNGEKNNGIKILVVDADSSDLSSGLTCPPANFVEESFLLLVKSFLSVGGLFIINLVSRSSAIRDMVVSRLKAVFECVYSLQLEEDVNEVLFASPTERYIDINHFDEAVTKLKAMMKFTVQIETDAKRLQRLK